MSANELKTILVGVDGSENSAHGLEWAIALARRLDAEVVAAYVYPPPNPYEYADGYSAIVPVELDPGWRAEIRRLFEGEWTAALRGSGVKHRTLIGEGRPATVLARVAEDVDAGLVVVGRRGRGGFAELVLGSVSHELTLHCKRPVVVLPAPREAQVAAAAEAHAVAASGA